MALATRHYENFPVGSLLLPRAERRHLRRIYAFARTADDLADELQDVAALAGFRAAFTRQLRGEETDSEVPLLADLVASIRELDLPASLFFDLLDAFAIDLEVCQHDRESLLAYCRKSADPVGRLVLRVFGHRDPHADALSDRICTGLQLVNHLQDIREDWLERRRVYFPVEDLEQFGVRTEDLGATTATDGVRALVHHWADATAGMFREGWELTRIVRGRLRLELRAILAGAAAVLRHIRRIDHDVLGRHVRLTRTEKARIVGRGLLVRGMPPEFA